MAYALTILAAASLVSAATPPGFQPASGQDLVVDFGNTLINGQVVPKNTVANQPQIGTTQRLTGTSYTVIMVDLDIPTNNPRQTTTLLHWLQMGLTPDAQATRLGGQNNGGNNGGNNRQQENVFLLRNASQAPAAAYISPNPPARIPLSHTYAQILVDTSGVSTQSTSMTTLMNAAMNRQGFNVQQVLQQAGLQNKVVAGNFFNVTNPGPVQNGNDQQDGVAADSTGTNNSTTTTSSSTDSTTSTVTKSGATSLSAVSGAALLAGLVAIVFSL